MGGVFRPESSLRVILGLLRVLGDVAILVLSEAVLQVALQID